MTMATARLGFKSSFVVHSLPGNGVYLRSEDQEIVLRGRLAERLAALLDGSRARDELVESLADEFTPERVDRVLEQLLDRGFVGVNDPLRDRRVQAYWSLAEDQLTASATAQTVEVLALGDTDPSWFLEAASACSIQVAEVAEFLVVITDDYLHPRLAEINRQAIQAGTPWLIVRPVGRTIAVGPTFTPDRPGCWQCLLSQLRDPWSQGTLVQNSLALDRPPVATIGALPATIRLAMDLACTQLSGWFAGVRRPKDQSVVTLNTMDLRIDQHAMNPRPHCPACGDAERPSSPGVTVLPRRQLSPGLRGATSPDATLDAFAHLVSPVTGIVADLTVQPLPAEISYLCTANHRFDLNGRGGVAEPSRRGQSIGRGTTVQQARAGALAEALERYSGMFRGDEITVRGSYRALAESGAIHPNAVQLFSDRQFENRGSTNSADAGSSYVPDRFDVEGENDWSKVWSLSAGQERYLPTGMLYYGYRHRTGKRGGADSNGNAAGGTLEEAILHGLLELVERDAVALWWYNRLTLPEIELESLADPYFLKCRSVYAGLGREIWLLDLTSDLGLPVVAALSRRTDQKTEDILLGLGAHLDLRTAATRAVTEMHQHLPAVLPADHGAGYRFGDAAQRKWWTKATIANEPYLAPAAGVTSSPADPARVRDGDVIADLSYLQGVIEQRGLEILVLDQTRIDVGLPVAKVVVPGLRPFWPRFAGGRLYSVPVDLGHVAEATAEENLNPWPMVL